MTRLTPRELETLRCRCKGMDHDHIAAKMGITAQTVKNHLTRTYAKLCVHASSPTALACYLLGMADVARVLPRSDDAMRPEAV